MVTTKLSRVAFFWQPRREIAEVQRVAAGHAGDRALLAGPPVLHDGGGTIHPEIAGIHLGLQPVEVLSVFRELDGLPQFSDSVKLPNAVPPAGDGFFCQVLEDVPVALGGHVLVLGLHAGRNAVTPRRAVEVRGPGSRVHVELQRKAVRKAPLVETALAGARPHVAILLELGNRPIAPGVVREMKNCSW